MGSLSRKLRRNKAKKDYKKNNQDMSFSDYWKFTEGKPIEPKTKHHTVMQPAPQPSPEETEQEKKRIESIETGKSFLKSLDILSKKVEDLKANDEHGEHD